MLTTEQLAIIKTDLLADPVLSALPASSDAVNKIIQAYALPSNPEFTVWDTRVDPNAIMANGIVWADFKNLSAGQLAIWELMTRKGYINAGKLNERLGLEEAFGKNTATSAGIQPHLKKTANRLEGLFATGVGNTANPGTLTVEGGIMYGEVLTMMGW